MNADEILLKVLKEVALQNHYDTNNIKPNKISGDSRNFTTSLYQATITTPGLADLKLFAKLATISEAMRATFPATRLFQIETIVYTELMPFYEKILKECNVSIEDYFKIPKFFGMRDVFLEETVILEDLSMLGFRDHDKQKTVTWEYAETAITELAKWHAQSMAFESLYPEEAEAIFKALTLEISLKGVSLGEGAKKIVKPELKEKLADSVKSFTAKDHFDIYHPFRKTVFAHGDFKPANMMHRTQDGKLEIMIVDYQTVHAGCPTYDLVYFIFTATDQEFRKKYYKKLINHYYTQLEKSLKNFKLDVNQLYSEQDFLADLDDSMKSHGLLIALFFLPIITADSENTLKLSDAEDIDCFGVAPSDMYADRFNGIMEDLVSWGYL